MWASGSAARVLPVLALAILLTAGCAQGSSGGDTGTGGGDSAVRRTDSGRDTGGPDPVDSGTPPVDTGPACEDEGHSGVCGGATDLGSLMVGDTAMPAPGVLPNGGDEDWFRVDFPAMTDGVPGVGLPAIELVMNEGGAFRIEVRSTCTTSYACPDGTPAEGIESWSFTDDQALEGETQWSTRDLPWPESAVIRVYRASGPGDCQQYQLGVSR